MTKTKSPDNHFFKGISGSQEAPVTACQKMPQTRGEQQQQQMTPQGF